jgi:hypothetical protein
VLISWKRIRASWRLRRLSTAAAQRAPRVAQQACFSYDDHVVIRSGCEPIHPPGFLTGQSVA